MCPLNTDDLHRIFKKLDQNGDGFVSIDELQWLLERIKIQTSVNELESLVGKTSLDIIDFMFFYDIIIKRNTNNDNNNNSSSDDNNDTEVERDLMKAFKVFDMNGDGFISCEELQGTLRRLGLWEEGCGWDCRSMIDVYDSNSDGLLDFEEFKNMMLPSSS